MSEPRSNGRTVWDQVVGQDRAVAHSSMPPPAAPSTPTCSSVRAARRNCRRRGPSPRTSSPAATTPTGATRRADPARRRTPTSTSSERAGPSISAEQAREIVRVTLARADRGRPQGADPRRVPPASAGRGGADAEDDRGAATVDDVPGPLPTSCRTTSSRSRRAACASTSERIGTDVITERLVAEGVDAGRRGHGRDRIARRHRPGPRARQRRTARRTTGGVRPRPAPLERHGFGRRPHRGRAAGDDRRRGRTADRASRAGDRRPRRADRRATASRGSGRKQLEERHERELRRHRTDELRAGLATLAGTYRNSVTAPGSTADIDECAKAVRLIHGALESLERNPNERLLVENLLWSLPDAHGV